MKSKKSKDFIPIILPNYNEEELLNKSEEFYQLMDKRRSVREFSDRAVPISVIERAILTASSAPSGAHKQPWTFCVVSDPEIKAKIRAAAEEEEYESYNNRMSDEWLADLEIFGTDWKKPFLELAPYLIIVFKKAYDIEGDKKRKNYYVNESVGIASGMLIAALHNVGLATLTHTPSPMKFLQEILNRPENERPFLLIPVGYPADDAMVPDLKRKGLDEVMVKY